MSLIITLTILLLVGPDTIFGFTAAMLLGIIIGTFSSFYISNPALVWLRVKGDSMIDAGIMDGDYVIVERGKEPRVGNVVLATVDSAWTLKYYRKDARGYYLEPANKKFKIIRPTESLEIPAVVVSVIRRYGK